MKCDHEKDKDICGMTACLRRIPCSEQERDKVFLQSLHKLGHECYPRLLNKTKALKLYNMLCQGNAFDAKESIATLQQKKLLETSRSMFTPWKVLKEIDTSDQGGLNIGAAAKYRNIQDLSKYERGMLYSKTSIVNASKKLEDYAKKIVDFELKKDFFGDIIQYKSFDRFIYESLKGYGLLEKAKSTGVEWGWSADGANMTARRGHCSLGCRPLDIDTLLPGTNKKIFFDGYGNNGMLQLKNYHIRPISSFMVTVLAKETKDLYRNHVRHFFDYIQQIEKHGFQYEGETYKIQGRFLADMSCHQKILNMGGPCKVVHHFCHCC